MILQDFNRIIKEHMDFSDSETLHTVAVTLESDQNQLLVALTGKLYDKIQDKADKIDFSSVARSRGDITKIENYTSLMECIDIIHNIVSEYKQDTTPVDTIITAVENIKSRDKMFKRAFVLDSNLPILVYNSVTMSIVTSVSFLIATCIEYIKDPKAESFQMALNTVAYSKTKQNLLFSNLEQFNKACQTRELDEAFDTIMKQSRVNKEAAAEIPIAHDSPFLSDDDIAADKSVVVHDDKECVQEGIGGIVSFVLTKAVIAVMNIIVPFIRTATYYFYYSKQKISDYFEVQSELIEMNAYKLQYNNTINEDEKKKIFTKQMKSAEKFRKWANKFNIEYTTTKKATLDQTKKEEVKYKVSDLDYNPNDETNNGVYASSLF